MKKVKIGICVCLAAVGSYVVADAWDIVPGLFTTKPPLTEPLPYPQLAEWEFTEQQTPQFNTRGEVDSAHVRTIVDEFRTDERVSGTVSVVVADPTTNTTLAAVNEQTPIRPASTMKYLTAVAALNKLGPNTTLDTTVRQDGSTIYLTGGGDVTLAAGEGDSQEIIGRAGLADLASQAAEKLAAAHTDTVSVYVDSSRYAEPIFHPAVVAEGNTEFVMPLRPIAVDRGKETPDKWSRFVSDPDIAAGQIFAEHLASHGISVTFEGRGEGPAQASEIGRSHSAPIRELVDVLMVESDNTLAEVLGHEVAIASDKPADFAGASAAVTEVLVSEGYPTGGMQIDDNSGLSENNRISATLLAEILHRAWDCDKCPINSVGAALPVGSLDGTLHNRFLDSVARGRVRAKTGTLSTTTALAGFVTTRSGQPLIFSFNVSDHAENAQLEVRAAMDDALAKIVDTM